MAIYTTPNATNTQDLYEIMRFVSNDVSGGLFLPLMVASFWFILFLLGFVNGRSASRGWIFASFVSSIFCILLGLMGLINTTYIYFSVILVGFGLIWLRLENAAS